MDTGITTTTNDFDDDYTAFYTADYFHVGTDGDVENDREVAIVIRCQNLEDYTDIDRNTDVEVLVVPVAVNDRTWDSISSCCGMDDEHRTNRHAVMEGCVGYGAYAHITRFGMGVTMPHCKSLYTSLEKVAATDDYDTITEWIEAHGAEIAQACAGLIGFALDGPQNRIGETGWDWLMPLMYDDYDSPTMFLHRR